MAITVYCNKDHSNAREVNGSHVRTFATGLVVATRERNMHDDSDFLATYWDTETNSWVEYEYATTRAYTHDCGASVDAPKELSEKWHNYCKVSELHRKYLKEVIEAATPAVGKRVIVKRGRKVPLNTEWWVIDVFGDHWGNVQLGMRSDTGGRTWTAIKNVDVI